MMDKGGIRCSSCKAAVRLLLLSLFLSSDLLIAAGVSVLLAVGGGVDKCRIAEVLEPGAEQ